MTEPLAQPLITLCEENFKCKHGEPRAFFEFPYPGKENEIVRVVYVTYVINAGTSDGAIAWMVDNVLMPLTRKAGTNPRLYWRLEDKFEMEQGERFILRTRIGVMTHDFEAVEIEHMAKFAGERTPRLDPRLEPQ